MHSLYRVAKWRGIVTNPTICYQFHSSSQGARSFWGEEYHMLQILLKFNEDIMFSRSTNSTQDKLVSSTLD